MNLKKALYLVVVTSFLCACGGKPEGSAASSAANATSVLQGVPAGASVATVNGEVITEPMLVVFIKGRGADPADPTARQLALDALIENVLLAQDAQARGVAARPEVQAELALVRLQQLAGRSLSDLRSSTSIGDDQLKAYYDQETARTGGIEVNLKHILFAEETPAMAAAARALAAGADFDALMAEYAAQGARQARDLGWANLSQLPPELAEATKAVTDGGTGPLPVQTSFGWHVFKRVASRPFAPPPFEQVKEGARKQLVDRAVADKVKALRASAKIETPATTP
jgi:peptidyl-prolyl cis-trans isomerase C